MTEKQYKLEQWTSSSLYYSFPDGNLHHSIGKVIARVENDLNSLYNENEQLKSICQDHRDHAIDFKADCVRLEKENEELKLLVQGWEALDEEKDGQLDKQNQALKKLKKENDELKVELNKLKEDLDYYKTKCASLETGLLQAQRDVEWVRDNTVWEQMPSNKRTITKTIKKKWW